MAKFLGLSYPTVRNRLDEIIERARCSGIDFVSIDVEGAEFDVLRGFDLGRHRPSLVLLEDHLFDVKSHRLLCASGYRLVKRTGLVCQQRAKGEGR